MESNNQIKIIKYSKAYKEDLLSFMSLLWKDLTREEKKITFEWRYEMNPIQTEDYMLLAVSDGKVVGFRAFVVQEYIVDQRKIKVLAGADGIVHPEFRKLGLLKRFNAKSIEVFSGQFQRTEGIILLLTANRIATVANLKQGWEKTTGLKKYAYKVFLINFFKRPFLKSGQKISIRQIKNRNLMIEVSTNLKDDLLAEYFFENREKNKIMNFRTAEFYRWRYAQDSNCLNRSYVYAYENDRLVGFLIIEKISNRQSKLQEYGAKRTQILTKMLKAASKHLNICVLRSLFTSKSQEKVMKRCGCFVETDFFLKLVKKERLPVLVRPNAIHPINKDFIYNGLDIRDIENWNLHFADGH